jgi:hypothetical protein
MTPPPKDDTIPVKAQRVFAGSYHSVVVDDEGRAYTWGARGSPCLGHGECLSLEGVWDASGLKPLARLELLHLYIYNIYIYAYIYSSYVYKVCGRIR